MKRGIYTTSFLYLIFSGFSFFTHGQGFTQLVQNRLQKVIDSFQNNPANPFIGGMSVAIKVDGLASWEGATGYAARNVDAQNNLLPGGIPFTPTTLSRIYSVTKTFTAPLVLELAREGAFGLDEMISKYLPLINVVNPGLNSAVTIRQLLAHESGYSNYTDEIALQIAVAFDPTHLWTPYEMISFVHQVSEPGAERRYSSTNYILLGALIEVTTGKPVEQHYRKRFFEPLGLKSMYLGGREEIGSRGVLASPHDNISAFNPIFMLTGQPTFPGSHTNISRFPMDAIVSLAFTGGGIISNAANLAEWGIALFSGRATSPSTLNSMLKSISPTPDDDGDKLGYGIFVTPRISETDYFIGHNGRAPGYQSVMFYQPDRKMTLVVLTNFYGADPYAVAKALYASLPDFLCGNSHKKEDKIVVCFKGKNICIDRNAAPGFIQKGAYLGGCDPSISKSNDRVNLKLHSPAAQHKLEVFPNPFTNIISYSFTVPASGTAILQVYDIGGKLLATAFKGFVPKNTLQKGNFDGSNLPAGNYIIRLQSALGITEQMVLRNN